MNNIFNKFTKAIRKPNRIPVFINVKLREIVQLLKDYKFVAIFLYIIGGIVGWDWQQFYAQLVSRKNNCKYIIRRIHGVPMILHIDDKGIGTELLIYGTRETLTTRKFIDILSRVKEKHDEVVVFDVGANIGYFVVQEGVILGDNATVYAFEPSPPNVRMLNLNANLNNIGKNVTIVDKALGCEHSTETLEIGEKSNYTRIAGLSNEGDVINKTEIDILPFDDFVENNNISGEYFVIRIDVEGYEPSVFKGMNEFLNSDQPGLVFVELHRPKVLTKKHNEMIKRLQSNGFELIYVGNSAGTEEFDAKTFDEIYPLDEKYPRGKNGTHIICERS